MKAILFAMMACGLVNAQEPKRESHRDLDLWQSIKRALTAEDGAKYFEESFKGAMIPGGANGLSMFKTTVVSAEPADAPSTLVVAIADTTTPEVTLRLEGTLTRKLKPGDNVWFEGVAAQFSKEPFMVTFDVLNGGLKFEQPKGAAKREIPLPRP